MGEDQIEHCLYAGVYKHYKGGFYQVFGLAEHTETKERVVVYMSLTGAHLPGPRMRVRPATGPDGFFTDIAGGKKRFWYVGQEIPEFERVAK